MITIQQQLFLLELLFHGKLTRKETHKKGIFSNDGDFFKQIKELKDFGYVINRSHGSNRVYYCLTSNGWGFANILALQSNSDKRFRKIAKEIAWLP